jgi:hypothetical protein
LKSYFGIALIIVIGVGAYFYMDANDVAGPRQLTTLEHVGDECTLIAEKAAAALPEVLPFQKLEKAARQSRVLQSCMNDRGYMENPAWKAYAEPIAKKSAEQDNISVNEAYETLRRNKMVTFYESDAKTPLYWIPSKS